MTFLKKLTAVVSKCNSLLCVGLDSDIDKIPKDLRSEEYPQFVFNKTTIDATHDLVCAYKPSSSFYEARGADGIAELKMTCDYLREVYPEVPIILDAKRADIGSTNEGYVALVDYLGVDAITLHPYLGREALLPFLDRENLGCIILCRTSNPGAGEIQDHVYKLVAQKVVKEWNAKGNCLMVVGATYPRELVEIRKIARDMWFLIPGIGAQRGDVGKTVRAGRNSKGEGMIINASRSIIFAQNPRKEAMKLRDQVNQYR